MRIDFHLHTRLSDGMLEPRELLQAIRRERLDAWAVTDHDTMAACEELAGEPGLVLGVEVTAGACNREVHLVGLGVDGRNPDLISLLASIRALRRRRAQVLIERLPRDVARGLTVEEISDGRAEALGRNHLARAIVRRGGAVSIQEVFALHLGDEHVQDASLPAFPPLAACCAAIHAAGGLAILAHPGVYHSLTMVASLLDQGCDGLEVNHPNLDPMVGAEIAALAQARGCYVSAGSDLHQLGARRPGMCQLSDVQLKPLAERLGLSLA